MSHYYQLSQMGWKPFFQQQLSLEEFEEHDIYRVSSVSRGHIECFGERNIQTIPLLSYYSDAAVGDWLLLNKQGAVVRILERFSEFRRKAAGSKVESQLMAANVDMAFIVCSLNDDFSLNRIERYLALVKEAGAEPVVILTKADLCNGIDDYLQKVQGLDPLLRVQAVNALDASSSQSLMQLALSGKTIAFLGSSGVGKSTLINQLSSSHQSTGSIRMDDDKGRHTTTARSLHFLSCGGVLIDMPGMRELQLADCESGVNATFADIYQLSAACRFTDCQHQEEPGCAVQKAIEEGGLERRRLEHYRRLMREQFVNGASLAEKRSRDKAMSRMYRKVQQAARASKHK
ncbi:ribosome small subunit-dependent GTPase A [Pleionea sp. CnH1-48]|uniref:ribosome small subunit-dependent GTPase A n=1 Tax=Pleionea sp. CnH1-48 TaxID=2954494 RepID=UPI0020985B84|nr:ribosome small subunit-dependent GTPase A [Pleionea sp. CnH1-48]MCO7226836.1 ribosome small subunit-dependent GTPase A [Pleionea sp. CnH1-48]